MKPGSRAIKQTNEPKMITRIKYLLLLAVILIPSRADSQSTDRIILEVGISRHEFGDYKGAIEAYTMAIEINPEFSLAYNNRGISKSALGDDRGAIEDFTRSLEIDAKYPPALLNRAASRYNLQDYYGAIEDYGQVLKMEPDNPIAWYGRGISHLQIRYLIGACEDLNRAVELGYHFAQELLDEHCK
jgi:tetratricopeptide (TPR) repeat protein